MAQIFISYSRKDLSFVEKLAGDLKNAGFEVWYDLSGLAGGAHWRREIEGAIKNSQYIVVVLSPDSVESEWVEREFLFASDRDRPIIPVMYRTCELPMNYLNLNYVDFRGDKYRKNFDELLEALNIKSATGILPASTRKKPTFALKIGLSIVLTVAVLAILAVSLRRLFNGSSPVVVAASQTMGSSPATEVLPSPTTEVSQVSLIPTETFVPTEASTPTSAPWPTEITDAKGVEMILVPAGEFSMGSVNGSADEQPIHSVNLKAFYMDKYEVSNGLYQACVDAGICQPLKNRGSATRNRYYGNTDFQDFPVIYVDWNMADSYCEWRGARLPTEAEWEKAARGQSSFAYPWGEAVNCDRANFGSCSGDVSSVKVHELGKSVYGIYNMSGNVWEWVNDWYSNTYYQYSSQDNPQGPDTGKKKILRGGSWKDSAIEVRAVNRYAENPANFNSFVGFRCASDVNP